MGCVPSVSDCGLVIINNVPVCHQLIWQYKFVYLKHDPVIIFVRVARTGSPELMLALWFLCQLWDNRWYLLWHNLFSAIS